MTLNEELITEKSLSEESILNPTHLKIQGSRVECLASMRPWVHSVASQKLTQNLDNSSFS